MICIGPLQVDLARREIALDGQPVRLGSRAFDILAILIAADGALVSKNDMLRLVWPDTIVEENNLQVHMSALRKVLGESRALIQTVSGRGYRLVLPGSPAAASEDTNRDERNARIAPVPNNLPSNASELIGRDTALVDITLALDSTPIVTLVGAGGIGKTRLAIEVARGLLERFPDGVYLVPLASASDAGSVLATFAATLGVNPATGPLTLARVSKELSGRRALFVLDNCEHVLCPAAELTESLLNVSSDLRVLATSREALRVMAERLYWVESLEVPAQDEEGVDILARSAVKLFLSRARAIDPRFSSDDRRIHLTGMVCRRLDGIPLAIELAAARAAILGIETLADHLDDRFGMLNGGNRTALPRHQTLKATLDWSHALLDDAERTTLRRLGIFVNSFTIDAAIAVAGDGALRESDVITAVSGLVEKSLVVTRAERCTTSYRLLETTRAYALQKLEDNGERRLVTQNHARYFASLLEWHRSDGANAAGVLADGSHCRMREVLDDLRAALGWALSPKGDEALGETLAVKVVALLYELSMVDECCAWARRALDTMATRHEGSRSTRHLRLRMQLLAALGAALVYVNGPNKEIRDIWAEVLATALALGDRAFEARALWGLWNACQSSGAVQSALAFAKRFAQLAAETNDAGNVMLGHRLLGIASHYAGDQKAARLSLERLLQHSDGLRHRLPLGQSVDQRVVGQATLARVLWLQGCRDQALALAHDCVAGACDQEQAIVTCYVLVEALVPLALLAGKREQAAEAIALLGDVSERAGLSVSQACCRAFDAYLRTLEPTAPQALQVCLEDFHAALDDLEALEYGAPRAMLAAQYGMALGRAGRQEDGIAAVARTFAQCDEAGDLWYAGELRRSHGELLLMDPTGEPPCGDNATDAEVCFTMALEESLAQGCRSLQLRAATSLGRLWHAQGKSAEAVQLLKSACARLTEGLDCDDFKAATRLLRTASAASAQDDAHAAHVSLARPPP